MRMIGNFCLAALAAALFLAGCSKTIRPEDIAGKTYLYEKDGFGGNFTIRLEEDGTFTYYEGFLSSYIGTGDWTLEGDTVTLQEKTRHFCFRVKENDLIFRAEDSGKFTYLTVADGERFSATDAAN